jgi:hypothetical protein
MEEWVEVAEERVKVDGRERERERETNSKRVTANEFGSDSVDI